MVLGGRPPGRVGRRRNFSINNPGFGRGCLHFRVYSYMRSLHLSPMSERPSNSGRPDRGSGPRRSGDSRPGGKARPPRGDSRGGDDRAPRSFDRDSRPPRGDRDDRPRRFDRDAPRGAPRGDRDDRPRSFDRDSRPPRSFDRDSRPPRGDRDDRPRRFDRDAPRGAPRGDRDDRPRSFDRDSRPPRSFDRDSRPPRGDRDDRPRRFDRDAPRGAPRGDRDDRPRSFDRDSRPPRSFDRDSRPPRGDRDDRPRSFDRDSRPPRGDRDDRPRRFDRDAPRGAPRGDRDDRPRSFDRDSRPPRSFDRDSRPPRGDRDDRPRSFDRDSRPPRGDRDDRPRRFDRDSRPPRTAAQERSDEVKGRIGERRTSGEMSLPPERSREDWVDEGSVRPARKAPSFGPRSKGTGRPQKGGRKEVRALDSVIEQFEKALGSKASPRALKRYDAALQAFEAHRYDDARKILNPMSREYSQVAAVREMLGLCLYRAGQWKRALVEFEASLKLNPDWIFNHAVIADCHRALGEHHMVEKYWQELQETSPHPELMAEGRIVMAGSMADRRQITEALALMEKASGDMSRPSEYHLRQWFVIADLYDKEGNVIKARQFFERIAAIDPGFVDVAERLSTLGA